MILVAQSHAEGPHWISFWGALLVFACPRGTTPSRCSPCRASWYLVAKKECRPRLPWANRKVSHDGNVVPADEWAITVLTVVVCFLFFCLFVGATCFFWSHIAQMSTVWEGALSWCKTQQWMSFCRIVFEVFIFFPEMFHPLGHCSWLPGRFPVDPHNVY